MENENTPENGTPDKEKLKQEVDAYIATLLPDADVARFWGIYDEIKQADPDSVCLGSDDILSVAERWRDAGDEAKGPEAMSNNVANLVRYALYGISSRISVLRTTEGGEQVKEELRLFIPCLLAIHLATSLLEDNQALANVIVTQQEKNKELAESVLKQQTEIQQLKVGTKVKSVLTRVQ